MRLILVRHGETDANAQSLYAGKRDLPLNREGRRQAAAVARRLAHEPIHAIYSSPLKRAQETAQPIAKEHQLPLQIDSRLVEQDYGAFEGMPFGSIADAAREAGIPYHLYTGHKGESLEMVRARAAKALDELYHQYKGKTVAVVAHGAFLRATLMHLLKLPADDIQELRLKNASVTIVEIDDSGDHKAHVIDSIEHLS